MNKRIHLLLLEKQYIKPDEKSVLSNNFSEKHQLFLYPYIKGDYTLKLDDDFDEKRHIGENDSYICSLIRQDSIEVFIAYVNQHDIPLKGQIKCSIYETHSLLQDKTPTLIEYASFFGSIRIFELGSSLWKYSIYSNNSEIIQTLEDNDVQSVDQTYHECLKESIIYQTQFIEKTK